MDVVPRIQDVLCVVQYRFVFIERLVTLVILSRPLRLGAGNATVSGNVLEWEIETDVLVHFSIFVDNLIVIINDNYLSCLILGRPLRLGSRNVIVSENVLK